MHSLPAIRFYLSFLPICQTQNSRFLLSQLSKTVIFSVLLIPGKGREKWFILSSPPSSCNFCRVCLVVFLHRKQVGITESLVRRENSSVVRGLHIGRHCSVPVSTINFFGKGTESPSYQIHQAEEVFLYVHLLSISAAVHPGRVLSLYSRTSTTVNIYTLVFDPVQPAASHCHKTQILMSLSSQDLAA